MKGGYPRFRAAYSHEGYFCPNRRLGIFQGLCTHRRTEIPIHAGFREAILFHECLIASYRSFPPVGPLTDNGPTLSDKSPITSA
jgi:hypothetical protein